MSRRRVWIADDSPLEREAARRVLEGAYEVETFADGNTVIERLSSGEENHPDVLVLDWIMPDVSGLEVCRFLRVHQPQLSILMVTMHRATEQIVEGLSAGANDYLSKPYAPAELLARVGALVRTAELHERAEAAERIRARYAEERLRIAELYLGVVGHDLRNPLHALAAAGQLISTVELIPERQKMVGERISSSVKRMTEMIEQLLDLTRTRLGTGIPVRLDTTDLVVICKNMIEEFDLAWPGRVIKLEGPASVPATVDRNRMAQAITNLVSNALQHGDPGKPVVIRLSHSSEAIQIAVHNSGNPIGPKLLAVIFDPFSAGETRQTPATHGRGLGLGLYICRQIVEAHGGTVDVRSDGEGTTFRIRLPARD